jgi:hypothetical protein
MDDENGPRPRISKYQLQKHEQCLCVEHVAIQKFRGILPAEYQLLSEGIGE